MSYLYAIDEKDIAYYDSKVKAEGLSQFSKIIQLCFYSGKNKQIATNRMRAPWNIINQPEH